LLDGAELVELRLVDPEIPNLVRHVGRVEPGAGGRPK
jgi:hypothetical protein